MTNKKITGTDSIPDEDETVKRIRENRDLSNKSIEEATPGDEFNHYFEPGKPVWKILE